MTYKKMVSSLAALMLANTLPMNIIITSYAKESADVWTWGTENTATNMGTAGLTSDPNIDSSTVEFIGSIVPHYFNVTSKNELGIENQNIGFSNLQNKGIQYVSFVDVKSLKAIGTYYYNDPILGTLAANKSAFRFNEIRKIYWNSDDFYTNDIAIGEYVFAGNKLQSLDMPTKVKSIGNSAFTSNEIVSIEGWDSITRLGSLAFERNKLVSSLPNGYTFEIPKTLYAIYTRTFYDNDLTYVKIPENIRSVESFAFGENPINSIYIDTNIINIHDDALSSYYVQNGTLYAVKRENPEQVTVYGHGESSPAKTFAANNGFRYVNVDVIENALFDAEEAVTENKINEAYDKVNAMEESQLKEEYLKRLLISENSLAEKLKAEETAAENFIYSVGNYGGPEMIQIDGLAPGVQLKEIVIPKKIDGINVYVVRLKNLGLEKLDVSRATELRLLNVDGNKLTNLDVNGLSNLDYLSAADNQIKEINLNGLSKLKQIQLSNNAEIENLDITYAEDLTLLEVSGGGIKEIDLSKNKKLERLVLQGNNLDQIDLSKNTALKHLDLFGNNLKSIDFSGSEKLEVIYLGKNLLEELDLSQLPNPQSVSQLKVQNNLLKELDVSNATNLSLINANENKLTDLDVNGLLKLQYLHASNNQIKEINLSGLPKLLEIALNNNLKIEKIDTTSAKDLTLLEVLGGGIKEIDLSKNKKLQRLVLQGNNLDEIDLSENTALYYLNLFGNNFKIIDLSNNENLKEIYLGRNFLEELDLRVLPNPQLLSQLQVQQNLLKELDISMFHNLRTLNAYGNKLTSIKISKNINSLERYEFGENPIASIYFDNENTFIPEGALSSRTIYKENPERVTVYGQGENSTAKIFAANNGFRYVDVDEIENAVFFAEEDPTENVINEAYNKINAMEDGPTKQEYLDRLSISEDLVAEKYVEQAEGTVERNSYNTAKHYLSSIETSAIRKLYEERLVLVSKAIETKRYIEIKQSVKDASENLTVELLNQYKEEIKSFEITEEQILTIEWLNQQKEEIESLETIEDENPANDLLNPKQEEIESLETIEDENPANDLLNPKQEETESLETTEDENSTLSKLGASGLEGVQHSYKPTLSNNLYEQLIEETNRDKHNEQLEQMANKEPIDVLQDKIDELTKSDEAEDKLVGLTSDTLEEDRSIQAKSKADKEGNKSLKNLLIIVSGLLSIGLSCVIVISIWTKR